MDCRGNIALFRDYLRVIQEIREYIYLRSIFPDSQLSTSNQ